MEHEIIAAVAAYLGARGTSFLEELLKPTATEMGEDLSSYYKKWKSRNLAEVVKKTEVMVKDSGMKIEAIPGRIIFRYLESASYEDDSDLQSRWAALIANAAVANPEKPILPAYAEILRQLTPVQAKMIQWMYEAANTQISPGKRVRYDIEMEEIRPRFNLTQGQYVLLASDLHRLQVIDGQRHVDMVDPTGNFKEAGAYTSASLYGRIGLTPLGINFLIACEPPKAKEKD